MHPPDRRDFLHAAGGLAAALAAGPHLVAAPREVAPPPRSATGHDTLFLTWQRDPCTTMTVQWVGRQFAPADTTIQYAPFVPRFGAPAWKTATAAAAPFPLTDLTRFRAELTGLTPGGEYVMRVGGEPGLYRFRTMPAKATDALTFVSGGDCGVGPHTDANNALAGKQDPWFAVIGGDLAYDNGKDPKATLAWLRSYSKHVVDTKGRLVPMVVCVGNHEVNGGYNKPREAAPLFLSLFDGLFADASYAALDFGDYLSLVLLDTGHLSKIGGEQTAWLESALKDRLDRPHLIAVNHVPAYPSYRPAAAAAVPGKDAKAGTGEDNRKHWVPLFERYAVDVVLEHHDHTFKRTHPLTGGLRDKNGILYLGDGSWGKLRSPTKAESRPYLAAFGAHHLSVHRLEGEQRFHLALEEGGKVVDVCTTGKKPRRRG